jgi:hypothetical protein
LSCVVGRPIPDSVKAFRVRRWWVRNRELRHVDHRPMHPVLYRRFPNIECCIAVLLKVEGFHGVSERIQRVEPRWKMRSNISARRFICEFNPDLADVRGTYSVKQCGVLRVRVVGEWVE